MKRVKNISIVARIMLMLLFLKCFTTSCKAQDVDYKAYTLFVYNFMKYVEWPEAQSKGDFVVGIYGESPIHKELQALATNKKLKGRTIVVRSISKPEDVLSCQLLYVPSSKSSIVKTFREAIRDKPVLIVGEREGLARKGAALSFVTMDDDALKFDINKKEIEQHQLKVSSSLISLGIQVN